MRGVWGCARGVWGCVRGVLGVWGVLGDLFKGLLVIEGLSPVLMLVDELRRRVREASTLQRPVERRVTGGKKARKSGGGY